MSNSVDQEDIPHEELTSSFRNKLNKLSARSNADPNYKDQFKTLQKYLTELSDQNEILVQTIEELEKDSNDRILFLENKLLQTEQLLQETHNKSDHLQQKIKNYEDQKQEIESHMHLFEKEATTMVEENLQYQSHINELEADVNQLVELIKQARIDGKWELSRLTLKAIPIESLLQKETVVDPLPRKDTEVATENHVDELKLQLYARDRTISILQKELKQRTEQYHQIVDQMSHTGEMVDSVKNDVHHLEKLQEQNSNVTTQKDVLLRKLQDQIKEKTEKEERLLQLLHSEQDHVERLKNDNMALQDALDFHGMELNNKDQSIEILERQVKTLKEKILSDSLDSDPRETFQLQLEDANEKINELHQYINELKLNKEEEKKAFTNEILQLKQVIQILENDLNSENGKTSSQANIIEQLEKQLSSEKTKGSSLQLSLDSKLSETESTFKKDMQRREREMKVLKGQIQRLENLNSDCEAKVVLRDKAIERLQIQQKGYMEEVTRRDSALHKSELKLLQFEDDLRKANEDLKSSKKNLNMSNAELKTLKTQHNEVITEKGRLEAQIKARQISNESEASILNEEVTKREELIQHLKHENFSLKQNMELTQQMLEDHSNNLEVKEEELNKFKDRVHEKEKQILEFEAHISELHSKDEAHKNKIEEYEDEAREIILKLHAAERAHEQESYKLLLSEEQIQEISNELDAVQVEHDNALKELSVKNLTIEQLTHDSTQLKKYVQEKDRIIQENQEKLKKSEQNRSSVVAELEDLKREIADNMSSKEHKVEMLKEELRLSQQRYTDVNEELTTVEMQLESSNKECRELVVKVQQLQDQLHENKDDVQEYEMNLAVVSEKHTTSVKENALKDQTILNLQSELDAVQQEFESTVEELAQKTEDSENLQMSVTELKGKLNNFEATNDNLSKKIEENIDAINNLQMTNSALTSQVNELIDTNQELKDKLLDSQDSSKKMIDEMKNQIRKLENQCSEIEMENKTLTFKLASENEKYSELIIVKNKEGDDKEMALFKYEDLREKFENFKTEKEEETNNLSEKVNKLETKLHESTLKISQFDGSLQLTQEKLKNTEAQLFESERTASISENTIESLEEQIKNLKSNVSKQSKEMEDLEKRCSAYSVKIQTQMENTTVIQNELVSTKEKFDDAKLRNTRCEEIIHEMREKLASKIHDSEYQNNLHSQLQIEHKTLQEIHERVQEELASVEKLNSEYCKENTNMQEEMNDGKFKIQSLERDIAELLKKLNQADEMKQRSDEKITHLDDKFASLKSSLEKDNFSLLEENCHLKETLNETTSNVKSLEQANMVKLEENKLLQDKFEHLTELLTEKENELDRRNEEYFNCEQTMNELHDQLQHVLEEKKALVLETSNQLGDITQLKSEAIEVRQQFMETSQKLAHYQEKVSLTERNLAATQDKLSSKITEIVKLEKLARRLQSDCQKLQEDKKSKEIKIGELNKLYEQSQNDIFRLSDKCERLTEQGQAQKSTMVTYEEQLDESHKQTEELSLQIEKQRHVMKETEKSLAEVTVKLQYSEEKVEQLSDKNDRQARQIQHLTDQHDEISSKLRDSKNSNAQLHSELENLLGKNKSCFEQISTKDAELRVLISEQHALQRKCSHQEKQLAKTADQSQRQLKEIHELKEASNNAFDSISSREYESEKLRSELLKVQSNLDESVEQLTSKAKQLASLKTEFLTIEQAKNQYEQQFSIVDSKNKKLKAELKKCLERNKTLSGELAVLTKNYGDMKTQLQQTYDQQRKFNEDITKREEKIVTLKVDYASIEERFKLKDEEGERLKNEVLRLNQQHHKVLEQLQSTRQELDTVKLNGDKLTRESELVVENMSTWVKEQREGNEKVATKLSNQNDKISELEASNRKFKEENNRLKIQVSSFKNSLGEKRSDKERLKKFQSQSAQQNVVVQQMKSRIEDLETRIEKEKRDKQEEKEELQARLKGNAETIQQLHKQLSELNKENFRQRTLLERQTISRKNLHAQLKSKENDIELLRSDLDRSISERDLSQDHTLRNSRYSKTDSVNSLLGKELDRASVSSAEALDKKYWIHRVGELSTQLDQNSDYWTQKLSSMTRHDR